MVCCWCTPRCLFNWNRIDYFCEKKDGNKQSQLNSANNLVENSTEVTFSKESMVTAKYCETVYYPFVDHIRRQRYGFSGSKFDVPAHLKAVSWFDGCASPLKLITSQEKMKEVIKRNIACCKHSASRTTVEQAADTGCMWKQLKK